MDPPLECLFVPSNAVSHKLPVLQREAALAECRELDVTSLSADVLIVADEGPSWGHRSIEFISVLSKAWAVFLEGYRANPIEPPNPVLQVLLLLQNLRRC